MGAKMDNLNTMFQGYATCALWSSMDETTEQGGEPLDKNFSTIDLSGDSQEIMMKDCWYFLEIVGYSGISLAGLDFSQIGHDLWLTRNHHGTGFWDGDYDNVCEGLGDKLTKIAVDMGECHLFVCDEIIEVY